jgi:hypothetical protein
MTSQDHLDAEQHSDAAREQARFDAELHKLRAETQKLDTERAQLGGRTWAVRVMLPTLLGSTAAAWASLVFSDSLVERTRAEIRRDVLQAYFGVDNDTPGKREQIINFVDALADEDEVLAAWAAKERQIIEAGKLELEGDMGAADQRLKRHDAQLELVAQKSRLAFDFLRWKSTSDAWLEQSGGGVEVVPGAVGTLLTSEQNLVMMELIEASGSPRLPGIHAGDSACALLAAGLKPHRTADRTIVVPVSERERLLDIAEECRGELMSWVLEVSSEHRLEAAASRQALADDIEDMDKRGEPAPP